jgi:hypothetical protein
MFKKLFMIQIFLFFSCSAIADNLQFNSEQARSNVDIHRYDAQLYQLNKNIEKKMKIKNIEEKAETLAKDLQDVLAAKMLNTLYEGIQPNPVFGGGHGEKMYQSLLND